MAQCVTCGSELHPERAERYDYCTKRECRERNARPLTIAAVAVNKAADQYLVLDERAREDLAAGRYQDRRKSASIADGPPRERTRTPPTGTRSARPTSPAQQPQRRRSWSRPQEELALIYSARGMRPDEIAERLGMHAAFGAPSLPPPPDPPERPDQAGLEVGVAVLSRWPVLEVRRHRLPSRHRPEIVALEAVLDHPGGPLHVVASCIDWEREYAAQRLAQTRALAALLTDPARDGPLPVLLTADLNAAPATPEIRALTDVVEDAWVAAGGAADAGHTLSSANPLAPRGAWWLLDQRIDYVLARAGTPARPVVVERASVAGDRRDGAPPSDHYAVVADFRLERP